MNDGKKSAEEIRGELKRLGLNPSENPYGNVAASREALEQLLALLRKMRPGVTWRDVHPDMPAHWELGNPATWTVPFKPLGDFDFQQEPAGTAFLLRWVEPNAEARHHELVEYARSEGWPVYGGAIKPTNGEGYEMNIGFIVLPLGVDADTVWAMQEWLLAQPGVRHSLRYRSEREDEEE
jgi:hypothetical protein